MKSNLLINLVCALCLGAFCLPNMVWAADQAKPAPGGTDVIFAPPPAPSINVFTPNGGDKLLVGSTYTVKWSCVSSAVYYNLYLSTDGGKSYTALASELGTGECSHEWKILESPSHECFVRVEAKLEDGRIILDNSDAAFEISATQGENEALDKSKSTKDKPVSGTPSEGNIAVSSIVVPVLIVKAPNGGESYNGGSTVEISWNCEPSALNYNVYWSHDGGKSFSVIEEQLDVSKCSYEWMTPVSATTLDNCLVKVVAKSSTNLIIEDVSDRSFAIVIKPGKVPTPK